MISKDTQKLLRCAQLLGRGEAQEAAQLYKSLGKLRLKDARELRVLSFVALSLGDIERAKKAAQRALRAGDPSAMVHANLGLIARHKGELEDALSHFERALELTTEEALETSEIDVLNNLSLTLEDLGRYEEAHGYVTRALERSPDEPDLLNLAGSILVALHRTEEAIETFERCLEQAREYHAARLNLGQAQLQLGDYEGGWGNFQARLYGQSRPFVESPVWEGQKLEGKRLLLWHEQGLGDTLQFVRYVPHVAKQAAQVVLMVQPPLRLLLAQLEETYPNVSLTTAIEPPREVDLHLPLMSTPMALRHEFDGQEPPFPNQTPYLVGNGTPHPAVLPASSHETPEASGRRIGLVWAGNPNHEKDRHRSIALESLLQGLETGNGGHEWFSLQFGPAEAQARRGLAKRKGIQAIGNDLACFSDFAATLSQLDLLITVDTAAAHLAGALGVPCLVLLAWDADWRWGRTQEHSPWYPQLTLLRQSEPGDWSGPLTLAKNHLS